MAILLGVGMVIVLVVAVAITLAVLVRKGVFKSKSKSTTAVEEDEPVVLPRQTAETIKDCGYGGSWARGWYDVQGQGVKNDYCRYVGDSPYVSCALAGSTDQFSTRGVYDLGGSKVLNPNTKPHDAALPGTVCGGAVA